MAKQETIKDLVKQMEASFRDWEHIKEYGCMDPAWPDGSNMDLVRNHIIYYRRRIEELCKEQGIPLPEIMNRELPPEVSMDYMAQVDVIREAAAEALRLYRADPNFRRLKKIYGQIGNGDKKQTAVYILGYVRALERAIEADDLVTMRRHGRNPDGYLQAPKKFLEDVDLKDLSGQISMF